MKRLFLLLMIALTTNYASATSYYSSRDTSVVDTIQKLSSDQAFNLCFNSLEYWYSDSQSKDSIIIHLRSIISDYIKVVGIQSNNQEDLQRLYDLQKSIATSKCEEQLFTEQKRKKRWRKTSAIIALTAIAEGAAIYFLVR